FEVGWMLLLARVSSAAALSNGLADAVAHFWPAAGGHSGRLLIVVGSLVALTWINVIGVRAAARTGVTLAIAKFLPLAMFVIIGAFFVDLSQPRRLRWVPFPWGTSPRARCCCCLPMPVSRTCQRPPPSIATRVATCRSPC